MTALTEKEITTAIVKELKGYNCFVWKHWGGIHEQARRI